MRNINEKNILVIFVLIFTFVVYYLYQERESIVISEAQKRIDIILKTNKALHKYVEDVQKPVIYDLKKQKVLIQEWFDPRLLSFTYIARNIHQNYVDLETKDEKTPYSYKLAATNPRNSLNQADSFETDILNKFRNNELKEYTDLKDEDGKLYVYKAMPIGKNKQSCMKCHSTPEVAPKQLIDMYGPTAGFNEKVGDIRAMISLKIPVSDIFKTESNRVVKLSIIIFVILTIIYTFITIIIRKDKALSKQIDENMKKEKKTRAILDSSPSIIIIKDGNEIVDANESFLNFFNQYQNLEEFKQNHKSLCDFFEQTDDVDYVYQSTKNTKWIDYINRNQDKTFKVAMKHNDQLNHFIIKTQPVDYKEQNLIIIELVNITSQIELQKEMLEKEKLIQKQSKMAQMGEMIGNIAHQWRQPLSVISTGATGLKLQKEYDELTDDVFYDTCDVIDNNAQYLSKTIDDFRDFAKGEHKKGKFFIHEAIKQQLVLLEGTLKNSHIIVVKNIDENIQIDSYKNELSQALMNIINNAKDKLVETEQNKQSRLIFIKCYTEDKNIVITIKDNAGGIDENALPKIFDPYFTTKHKSQGTGLGLYMTHQIITSSLKGTIEAKNSNFEYENNNYLGAELIITLPLS